MKNQNYAFLGNKVRNYKVLTTFLVSFLFIEKFFNYKLLVIQKAVQSGSVKENWRTYLVLQLIVAFLATLCTLYGHFIQQWTEKTTKFNFYEYYENIIHGRKEACLLDFQYAWAKIWLFQALISFIINLGYTFVVMDIVVMTLPQYIGAGMILILGLLFGIFRGQLQQTTEKMNSGISVRQNILVDFLMPSSSILRDRLSNIDEKYSKRTFISIIKKVFEYLPSIIKTSIFIILMYGLVESMAENTIYSYSYIVATAYGFILEVAVAIGDVIEQISKINSYKKDNLLKDLYAFDQKETAIVESNNENCFFSENCLHITDSFTANVEQSTGERFYKVLTPLTAFTGKLTLLEAQNGVGKSRFLQLIKAIVPFNCFLYDKQTWMMLPSFAENFESREFTLDIKLISYLATGLKLERIPRTFTEFKDYSLNVSPNGADGQLMILLQIFYFAIKEHEKNPSKPQLIVLDEAFANISPETVEDIVKFISEIIKKLDCVCILVSHAHKETINRYISTTWYMCNSKNLKHINISEKYEPLL